LAPKDILLLLEQAGGRFVRVKLRSGTDVSGGIRLELVGESGEGIEGGGDDEVVGEGIESGGGLEWMFE